MIWLLGLIGLMTAASLLSFGVYGWDKRAARQAERRVPEKTLHLLAVAGGWPGALAAQRVFRHKTRKPSFQIVFWMTVVIHVSVCYWAVQELRGP